MLPASARTIAEVRRCGYAGDRLIKSWEVCQILGVSKDKLAEIIIRGNLSPVKLGEKSQRFFESEVIAFLEKLKADRLKVQIDGVDYSPDELRGLNAICGETLGAG